MSDKPTEKEILESIKDSGYLMEQEIASIFENENFFVITNSAFEDDEEGKSREIDVYAHNRIYESESNKVSIFVNFICECKNNTNPFVFIGRDKNNSDKYFTPTEFVFSKNRFEQKITEKLMVVQEPFNYFHLQKSHHFFQTKQKAVQFCKIVRNGKNWKAMHDGIYDSIFIPLVKALEYHKKKQKNYNSSVTLNYPIVVLNSDIFYVDSNNPENLTSVDHITFIREIRSKNINGKYMIEFVTKKGLLEFIKEKPKKVVNQLKKIIEAEPESFKR